MLEGLEELWGSLLGNLDAWREEMKRWRAYGLKLEYIGDRWRFILCGGRFRFLEFYGTPEKLERVELHDLTSYFGKVTRLPNIGFWEQVWEDWKKLGLLENASS